ncbi:MAG: response regulator [Planctomycetes bacterium]|nr:response regulator [Planctomycetota bacterium]
MSNERRSKVLIVDDQVDNLTLLNLYLKKLDVDIFMTDDSREVKGLFKHHHFDLALLDISMPYIDGISLCQWIKSDQRYRDCSVIFSTALDAEMNLDKALEAGGMDYLVKPIKGYELLARAKSALRYKKSLDEIHKSHAKQHATLFTLKHKNKEINDTILQLQEALFDIEKIQSTVLFSLSKLAESRDNETGSHLVRTQHYCKLICKALRLKDDYKHYITNHYINSIVESAPLHDIGKVGIPDAILRKKGSLNENEYEVMKTHPEIGANTLRDAAKQTGKFNFLKMAINISHFHHEKHDGSGYPFGLKGEEIPLSARIMCIADIYDALRCKRCYKDAYTHEKAMKIIVNQNGQSFFHPHILDAFQSKEKEFAQCAETFADS